MIKVTLTAPQVSVIHKAMYYFLNNSEYTAKEREEALDALQRMVDAI